jgi:hypothetical protein
MKKECLSFCGECYLDPECTKHRARIDHWGLDPNREPVPLENRAYGDIMRRIRESPRINAIPINDLDSFTGLELGHITDDIIEDMDSEISYRQEKEANPVRGEREVMVLLSMSCAMHNLQLK